jgi:predicted nuclease of predicted toxin-antitoxin system
MNLSPLWIDALTRDGHAAVHWSSIGDAGAADAVVMAHARANRQVLFTHDLDFGTILALTHANGPSVLQVRGQNIMPDHIGPVVISALARYEAELISGAIVVVNEHHARVRVLPL